MKIKALVKVLLAKEQDKEVEFIVAGKDKGDIVCMQMENQATAVIGALKLFKR